MSEELNSSAQLSTCIIEGMQDKKAEDIMLIDLRTIQNSICDYFVICSGTSDTHIDSISTSVNKVADEQLDESPTNVEGRTNREWILLDYGNVIAHIFKKETREFYGLENLWGDAPITHIEPAH